MEGFAYASSGDLWSLALEELQARDIHGCISIFQSDSQPVPVGYITLRQQL
jgi:hypothetical protein